MSNVIHLASLLYNKSKASLRRPIIDKRSEEDIAADIRASNGDMEKVPTANVSEIIFNGIKLSSRYSKHHELEMMISLVENINLLDCDLIEEVYCDSKSNNISVLLKDDVTANGAYDIYFLFKDIVTITPCEYPIFFERYSSYVPWCDSNGHKLDLVIYPDYDGLLNA